MRSLISQLIHNDFKKHLDTLGRTHGGFTKERFFCFFCRFKPNDDKVGFVVIDMATLSKLDYHDRRDLFNSFMKMSKSMSMISSYKDVFSYTSLDPFHEPEFLDFLVPMSNLGVDVMDFATSGEKIFESVAEELDQAEQAIFFVSDYSQVLTDALRKLGGTLLGKFVAPPSGPVL